MRAQQLTAPGPATEGRLQPVELPDPEPAPGELVLDVAACAVCRTDLQLVEAAIRTAIETFPMADANVALARLASGELKATAVLVNDAG